MTVSPAKVILYAATETDYRIALAASAIANVSAGNVTGVFAEAWRRAADGGYLVVAVGADASSSLAYNPCGWTDPADQTGGVTPFVTAGTPQSTLPGRNYYLNAAGETAADTLKRAVMLTWYAVHGAYPPGYGSVLPSAAAANNDCNPYMRSAVSCPC